MSESENNFARFNKIFFLRAAEKYADVNERMKEFESKFEDIFIKEILEEEFIDEEKDSEIPKKKRHLFKRSDDFWQTQWGQLISHPDVHNIRTRIAKRFRRRFRLPYPLFVHLVNICKSHNIFNMTYESRIPIEAKVLACLRILGRDHSADDINDSTGMIGESTANYIFHQFVEGITKYVYPNFVQVPTGELLQKVLSTYSRLGLPGCVGSMDCTRVRWFRCKKAEKWHATGKEGCPTLVFQVVVDHSRRILYCSNFFLGSNNDITICNNDNFSLKVLNGLFENVKYELYNAFGDKYNCLGGYIIVDGGYVDSIAFVDPDKFRMTREAVLWSEWVESVRKDVECVFGILKSRFRFFRNPISYRDPLMIEQAFKTACCLHNMILLFDEGANGHAKEWEAVDWETLDPEGDDDYTELEELNAEEEEDYLPSVNLNHPINTTTDPITGEEITMFKLSMSKRQLKDALQTSFTIQWIQQKLEWPKRFDNTQKSKLPLIRATIEMKRSLITKPSNLLAKDKSTGLFTRSIGKGLFSSLGYKRNDVIATFIGTIRSIPEYETICNLEPIRRSYSLISSTNGVVLDCYDHYKNGLCNASYANSPSGCFNTITKKKAVENCRLVVTNEANGKKTFTLRAGILKEGKRSSQFFYIPPNTELLWDYGDSFIGFE
jgi:hypothetical protein